VPAFELSDVRYRDVLQPQAQAIGCDGEAPQGVSELLGELVARNVARLKGTFTDEAQKLAGFLR
jgi:hypothetical protein